MDNKSFSQKLKEGVKKYAYYIVLGVMLLAVVLTLVVVGVVGSKHDNEPTKNVSVSVSPFLPLLNATIYKDYSMDALVYNATLKQWETHDGIDLQSASGSSVYSILDGKVVDVYSNILEGAVVVIEHEDGLRSTYASLDEDVLVEEGDMVNRGQELGTISDSSSSEASAGAHLHFSLDDNGKKIDPASYLNIATK